MMDEPVMKTLKLLLPALLLTGPAALSNSALAASDDEEMGAEDCGRARGQDKPVREIVKGFYARANVGGAFFLGNLNGFVSPGTYSSLGLGQDFVDSEKMSLAWEIAFSQGVHNGCYFEDQAIGGCSGNLKGKASPYIGPDQVEGEMVRRRLARGLGLPDAPPGCRLEPRRRRDVRPAADGRAVLP